MKSVKQNLYQKVPIIHSQVDPSLLMNFFFFDSLRLNPEINLFIKQLQMMIKPISNHTRSQLSQILLENIKHNQHLLKELENYPYNKLSEQVRSKKFKERLVQQILKPGVLNLVNYYLNKEYKEEEEICSCAGRILVLDFFRLSEQMSIESKIQEALQLHKEKDAFKDAKQYNEGKGEEKFYMIEIKAFQENVQIFDSKKVILKSFCLAREYEDCDSAQKKVLINLGNPELQNQCKLSARSGVRYANFIHNFKQYLILQPLSVFQFAIRHQTLHLSYLHHETKELSQVFTMNFIDSPSNFVHNQQIQNLPQKGSSNELLHVKALIKKYKVLTETGEQLSECINFWNKLLSKYGCRRQTLEIIIYAGRANYKAEHYDKAILLYLSGKQEIEKLQREQEGYIKDRNFLILLECEQMVAEMELTEESFTAEGFQSQKNVVKGRANFFEEMKKYPKLFEAQYKLFHMNFTLLSCRFYQKESEFTKAQELIEQIIKKYHSFLSQHSSIEINLLRHLSQLLYSQNKFQQAIRILQQIKTLFKGQQNQTENVSYWINEGNIGYLLYHHHDQLQIQRTHSHGEGDINLKKQGKSMLEDAVSELDQLYRQKSEMMRSERRLMVKLIQNLAKIYHEEREFEEELGMLATIHEILSDKGQTEKMQEIKDKIYAIKAKTQWEQK